MSEIFPRQLTPQGQLREKIFLKILDMIRELQLEISDEERQEIPDQPRLYYLQGQIDGLRWLWSTL